jgi:hypothetical protein
MATTTRRTAPVGVSLLLIVLGFVAVLTGIVALQALGGVLLLGALLLPFLSLSPPTERA